MKKGANTTDVKEMNALFSQGMPPEEISARLGIELKCVKGFLPKAVEEVKKKSAKKKKELDDDHHEIMEEKKKHKQEEAELASAAGN